MICGAGRSSWRIMASASKRPSTGRRAGARSTSAIPPETRWNFPTAHSGDFPPMRTLANQKIVIATHNKGKLEEFASF
jgi:hypothetical protein